MHSARRPCLSVFASAQQRSPAGDLAIDCTVTGRLATPAATAGPALARALVDATLPHTNLEAAVGRAPPAKRAPRLRSARAR